MAVKRLLLTLLFKNVIKSSLVFNIRPKLLRIHSKLFWVILLTNRKKADKHRR